MKTGPGAGVCGFVFLALTLWLTTTTGESKSVAPTRHARHGLCGNFLPPMRPWMWLSRGGSLRLRAARRGAQRTALEGLWDSEPGSDPPRPTPPGRASVCWVLLARGVGTGHRGPEEGPRVSPAGMVLPPRGSLGWCGAGYQGALGPEVRIVSEEAVPGAPGHVYGDHPLSAGARLGSCAPLPTATRLLGILGTTLSGPPSPAPPAPWSFVRSGVWRASLAFHFST